MTWSEFRDFALVGMLVFNVCLIVLLGHITNKNTVRVDRMEIKITNLESAVGVGILEIGRAVNDIELAVQQLRGIKEE